MTKRRVEMVRTYSREQACELSGATAEELAEFERRKLVVPQVRQFPPWGPRAPFYTAAQIEVLGWLVKTRRVRQHAVQSTEKLT